LNADRLEALATVKSSAFGLTLVQLAALRHQFLAENVHVMSPLTAVLTKSLWSSLMEAFINSCSARIPSGA
jgi:hypothetical protein